MDEGRSPAADACGGRRSDDVGRRNLFCALDRASRGGHASFVDTDSTRIKRRCFRESWLSRGLFTELCYVELLRSRWSRLRCDRRRRESRGTITACGRRVVVAAAADGGQAKRNDQRRGSSSG